MLILAHSTLQDATEQVTLARTWLQPWLLVAADQPLEPVQPALWRQVRVNHCLSSSSMAALHLHVLIHDMAACVDDVQP